MLRRGWHDVYSHADPDDKGPVIRFLKGKTLIQESEPMDVDVLLDMCFVIASLRYANLFVMREAPITCCPCIRYHSSFSVHVTY